MSNQEKKRMHEFSFEETMHYAFAPILQYYCEFYHTMLPTVVWSKAMEIKTLMSKEPGDPDDIVLIAIKETDKMRRNDKFVVLITLTHLLYEPLPGQDDVAMMDIMIGISKEIQYHPLRGKLMQEIDTQAHRDTLAGGTQQPNLHEAQLELVEKMVDYSIRASDFKTLQSLKMLIFELNLDEDHCYDTLLKEIRKYVPVDRHIENLKKEEKKDEKKEEKRDEKTAAATDEKEQAEEVPLTDDDVPLLLNGLMKAIGADGELLFRFGCQWIGVYRFYVDHTGKKKKFKSFFEFVDGTGTYRIPCLYQYVKKIDGMFCKPFEDWDRDKYEGEACAFDRQYTVVAWLEMKWDEIKKNRKAKQAS